MSARRESSSLSIQGKSLLMKGFGSEVDKMDVPPPPRDSSLNFDITRSPPPPPPLSPYLSPPPPPLSPNFGRSPLDSAKIPPPPSIQVPAESLGGTLLSGDDDDDDAAINGGKVGRATAAALKIKNLRKNEAKMKAAAAAAASSNKVYKIANVYVNEAVGDTSPFADRSIEMLSPEQFGVIVENTMVTPKSVRESQKIFPKLTKNDVIIVGAALRTGAVSVAKLVDSMINNSDSPTDLFRRVPWIESKITDDDPVLLNEFNLSNQGKKRAFLSFFSCATIQANIFPKKKGTDIPKIIVVVRHPLDVRLSYFRFVRRLYRKCKNGINNKIPFDNFLVADDFARIRLAPISNTTSVAAGVEYSYETNLCQWMSLQSQYKDHIKFVFYEDLLHNPSRLYDKVAEFIGREAMHFDKDPQLERVTTDDHEYPIGQSRIENGVGFITRKRGSSNKGHRKFCPLSVANIDIQWTKVVARTFPGVVSFEMFYSKMNECPFPIPPREYIDDAIEASMASLPPPNRRGHSRNASSNGGAGSKGDSGFEMIVGNNEALTKEIAKRYPHSYTARREATEGQPSLAQQPETKKKSKSIVQRLSIFAGFRKVPKAANPEKDQKKGEAADGFGKDEDDFTFSIDAGDSGGRSAATSFAISEVIDSDDSDIEQ